MKPVIGISAAYNDSSIELKHAYSRAITRAGGIPLALPFVEDDQDIGQVSRLLDGLLLSGGLDVSPLYYGEEPQPQLGKLSPQRDHLEFALTRHFLALDKPVFAICRGHQVLNAAVGGTLHQDIPSLDGKLQHSQNAPRDYLAHYVTVEEGTLLHQIAGSERFLVNTFHHQAVKDIAPGFMVTASASDGTIEAIESRTHRYVLGVQWHPEDTESNDEISAKLFRALIAACKENSPGRGERVGT